VREEPQGAQPVVDRDHDGAIRRKLGALIVAAAILRESTAVNPHQHRPITAMAVAHSPRVDVEVQTVL
jgi:hypothetical protein